MRQKIFFEREGKVSKIPRFDPPRNRFTLIRILGNDLPPRHKKGQTLENLQFILENEPNFKNCRKLFLLNRIVSAEEKENIINLLSRFNAEYVDIPFLEQEFREVAEDLQSIPWAYHPNNKKFFKLPEYIRNEVEAYALRNKNRYVMNNNGARNFAIEIGKGNSDWVLPFDGNCYLNQIAWDTLTQDIQAKPFVPYWIVPMARITDNKLALDPVFVPDAKEEPQIIFRSDAKERFDENFVYGRMPKVDLLKRLRVPGIWDKSLELYPWKRIYIWKKSKDAYKFAETSFVFRLNSGKKDLERNIYLRGIDRTRGIIEMIRGIQVSGIR
jgi:hypothetical protein